MPNDWASRKVEKAYSQLYIDEKGDVSTVEHDLNVLAKLLRAEHARTVRVIQRRLKAYSIDNLPPEFAGNDRLQKVALMVYEQACMDLLAAIQKGRG